MKMRTGISLNNFELLLSSLPSLKVHIKNSRKASDALFMYLMKIRTGLSNDNIAAYFGVGRTTVQSRLKSVRTVLMRDFVPLNVNYERTREDLVSHCSVLSKKIFCQHKEDSVVLIWDGTYIYIEKSQRHEFQKNSYSSHKKRNYVKPMMVVATDGTIIAVLGPFKATQNDAKIAEIILSENNHIFRNMETADVVVLDRGFRDCVAQFQSRGFIVKTPACQPLGKQLETLEANQSRLVTKIRYDVERINGMIKATFKIFNGVWESLSVPHLIDDLKIAAALLNKFFIKPNEDVQKSEDLATKMLARVSVKNELSKIVNGRRFKSILTQKQFLDIDLRDIFPQLSMDDLKCIAFGEYQIQQAKLYSWDHFKSNNGSFKTTSFPNAICQELFKDYASIEVEPALVMIDIASRFISGKMWRAFVLYNSNKNG